MGVGAVFRADLLEAGDGIKATTTFGFPPDISD